MDPLEHFTVIHATDHVEDNAVGQDTVAVQGVVGAQAVGLPGSADAAAAGPSGSQQVGAAVAPQVVPSNGVHSGDTSSLVVLVQLLEKQYLETKALLDRVATAM